MEVKSAHTSTAARAGFCSLTPTPLLEAAVTMTCARVHLEQVTPKQQVDNSIHSRQARSGEWDAATATTQAELGTDLSNYECLLPGQWIKCDIIEQWMQYLKFGMPSLAGLSKNNLLEPRPDVSGRARLPSRVLDLSEVCFLDTQVGKIVKRAHQSQDYKSVLRVLSGHCNFTTVKRVLLPLNTGQNSHGVHIADDGEGGHHWILAELNLSSNEVHLFDWMGNSPPKDYQQVSGVFLWSCAPCVAVLSQTNPATDNIIRLWLSLSSTTLRVAHCDAPEVPWCVCPRFR